MLLSARKIRSVLRFLFSPNVFIVKQMLSITTVDQVRILITGKNLYNSEFDL